MYDCSDDTLTTTLENHSGFVNCLEIHDGKLYTSGHDKTINVYECSDDRWNAQLIIGLFSALTFVITLYASIASNTTDITDSEKWQLFYRNSLGISCSGNGHTAYTGTGTCVVGFLSSFFTFMLVYFPTLGGRCGMCADLEAIPTDSDINKGLVDGDRKSTDSAYVPPIV